MVSGDGPIGHEAYLLGIDSLSSRSPAASDLSGCGWIPNTDPRASKADAVITSRVDSESDTCGTA